MRLLVLAVVVLFISAVIAVYLAELYKTSLEIADVAKATSMALVLASAIPLSVAVG